VKKRREQYGRKEGGKRDERKEEREKKGRKQEGRKEGSKREERKEARGKDDRKVFSKV
jgi:hypothetical protein